MAHGTWHIYEPEEVKCQGQMAITENLIQDTREKSQLKEQSQNNPAHVHTRRVCNPLQSTRKPRSLAFSPRWHWRKNAINNGTGMKKFLRLWILLLKNKGFYISFGFPFLSSEFILTHVDWKPPTPDFHVISRRIQTY